MYAGPRAFMLRQRAAMVLRRAVLGRFDFFPIILEYHEGALPPQWYCAASAGKYDPRHAVCRKNQTPCRVYRGRAFHFGQNLFCGVGRVGGAGVGAVDGLQLGKGRLHLGRDLHMGQEVFIPRAAERPQRVDGGGKFLQVRRKLPSTILQRKLHYAKGGVDGQQQDTLAAV